MIDDRYFRVWSVMGIGFLFFIFPKIERFLFFTVPIYNFLIKVRLLMLF